MIIGSKVAQAPPLIAAFALGGRPTFVAIDAVRSTVTMVSAAVLADASRVPELWLKPIDGKQRALGLLRFDRTVTIAIHDHFAAMAARNASWQVSLERPTASRADR